MVAAAIQITSIYGQTPPAQQKIGFVDSEVIFNALPEAIKAKGDLEAITKQWYAQVDSLNVKLQQDYANYQKQQTTLTAEKRKQIEQDLVTRDQNLKTMQQQKFGQGGEIYKKQEELFSPIKEKVIKGIQEVAKTEGLSFVFDKVGDTVLLYADAEYDITYKVLDKIKRGK
jgi:outer membrane protein